MNQQTNFSQKSREELAKEFKDLQDKKRELEIKLMQKDKSIEILLEIDALSENTEMPLSEVLEKAAHVAASGWQFPSIACVRILAGNIECRTPNFADSEWKLVEPFSFGNGQAGSIEVRYLEQTPDEDEGPFLKREKILLCLISKELAKIMERRQRQDESDLQEKIFSAAFYKSPVAKCLVNPLDNFKILEVNEKFLSLSGFSEEELNEKYLQDIDFYPKDILTLAIIPEFKLNDKLRNFEFVFRNKREEMKTTLLSADSITKELAVVVIYDITKLREDGRKVIPDENRLREMFEEMQDAYFQTNLAGNISLVSPSAWSMFGYNSEEEIIGKPASMLYADKNVRKALIDKIKRNEKVTDETLEGLKKDGSKLWVSMNVQFAYDRGGNIVGTQGLVRDITKRKEYEEKLLSFSRAVEQSPASIIITDVNGRIEYANPFFSELTGYSPKEYIGKTPRVLKSGYHPDMFYKQMWETIQSGQTWEGELYNRKKDRSLYWEKATIAPIKNEYGKIINFVAIKTDITESKEMTQKLVSAQKSSEENRKWFEALFYTSPAYVSITRLNGEYMDVNESFQAISGYTKQELIALKSTDIDIWVNPSDREKLLHALQATGHLDRMETTFRLRDGQHISAMVSAKLIELNHERLILMVTQDLTQLKEAEAELIAAKEKAEESDRLKTAFLLNMSHEIRTPMNGILGFTSLLNEPGLGDEERSQFIGMIDKSGERLLNTINDIIEISKIEVGDIILKHEPVNVEELMLFHYNFFKIQAEEKHLGFEAANQITGDQAELTTDKHKLDGILMNLIKNAIKFTAKGKIQIGNYLKDGHAWFYVSDTGKGIPRDKQDSIFDRFVQVDTSLARGHEGSGIGLSIVKAYLEMLKGSIHISSEVDKGSTFLFSIPYRPVNEKTEEPKTPAKATIGSTNSTILIVEDNEINYVFLKAALSKEFRLLHADNGEEAVRLFASHPEVSIILMDIKLVGKYDGIETTRKIREINQQIPIIAQTACATDADKTKALEAGCNGYISKPYSPEGIKTLIYKYLNKKE